MNKINFRKHNWLSEKINNTVLLAHNFLFKGRVIDLGCGTSQYKKDILKVADEYIGVDWKNSLHDQSNVDVFADICKPLPFADEYADTVSAFQVMEHLAEPELFLLECYRILKRGGMVFITVPFMWQVHEAPHDYYRYTRYGLEHLLKKTGFSEIEIKENTGFWQMWILKFNYHTTRFARGPLKLVWIPIWWLGQTIAPILDKYDKSPRECASYTVAARKP